MSAHDPNAIPDAAADAASIAHHEFCFGDEGPLTRRDLGIVRQASKVSIAAALDVLYPEGGVADGHHEDC